MHDNILQSESYIKCSLQIVRMTFRKGSKRLERPLSRKSIPFCPFSQRLTDNCGYAKFIYIVHTHIFGKTKHRFFIDRMVCKVYPIHTYTHIVANNNLFSLQKLVQLSSFPSAPSLPDNRMACKTHITCADTRIQIEQNESPPLLEKFCRSHCSFCRFCSVYKISAKASIFSAPTISCISA